MLDIGALLALDERFSSPATLKECFGDSFLYLHNPIFRRIRTLFIESTFRYVPVSDDRANGYYAAPLLWLNHVAGNDTVPFVNNSSVLRSLVAYNPDFRIAPEALLSFLTHNHVLHESCHLIAERVLPPCAESDVSQCVSVLRSLLCESFANASEFLSLGFANGSRLHRFFLAANCYLIYHPSLSFREQVYSKLISLFGFESVFELALLAFLHTNMHSTSPTGELVSAWSDVVFGTGRLNRAELMLLEIVLRNEFSLSPAFREKTTPTFFRIHKQEESFRNVQRLALDRDTLDKFDVCRSLKTLLALLANLSDGSNGQTSVLTDDRSAVARLPIQG
jgi:hypothetical protein